MLRNLTPPMRSFSMGLYGWLGCVTLETCVCAAGVCCLLLKGLLLPRLLPFLPLLGSCWGCCLAGRRTFAPAAGCLNCWPRCVPAVPAVPADIGQFHTWLLCKRPDGQPIYLLTLLPGYPLLNFAVVTAGGEGLSCKAVWVEGVGQAGPAGAWD